MSHLYESKGAKLYYRDAGSGIPCVFLHPTPLDQGYWDPLIENLVGVRAIAPDFRGHGLSELGHDLPRGKFSLAPRAPVLTIAHLAADVVTLLDHLQIPTAVFVGCSIGGYVLLELWRAIPSRMQALAFVCSKPQPDMEAGRQKRAATIASLEALGTGAAFDGMAQTLIGATARRRHPELLDQLRSRMTLTPEAAVAVQAGLAIRSNSVPTVSSIDVPVLAIAGGEDPACTVAEIEAFQAAPGGCEFHLLSDAGHFAAYEQPQKVASLIAEWLKSAASR